ncbi:hypothetical protein [Rosistilla oblonga]|uniref:hypothetical protein n=1 Tax=Rosistilla oblonga TaxID=2527990 RepID=UPI003A97E2C0
MKDPYAARGQRERRHRRQRRYNSRYAQRRRGDDKIIAGKNDVANGGAGDDVIIAKAGNVKVNGGAGNDTLDLSELPPDASQQRLMSPAA